MEEAPIGLEFSNLSGMEVDKEADGKKMVQELRPKFQFFVFGRPPFGFPVLNLNNVYGF